MKTNSLIDRSALAIITLLAAGQVHAQQASSTGVPAPVTAAFEKAFPHAMDVEWKVRGAQYKVEFETGLLFTDHEIWYDASGKLLRHEEEISTGDLPPAVGPAIGKDFPGYRVDEAERITVEGVVSYVVELDQHGQPDLKVAYDAAGKQLEKTQD